MQTFTQKKIVLAVGSALMLAAGVAQAATPPVLRATNPAVVASTAVVNDANTRALLSAAGLSGQAVTVSVNLTSNVTTATLDGDVLAATQAGALIASPAALDVADATLANRNVLAYTGTLSATTALPVTSALMAYITPNATGTAAINVVLTAPVAPAAYRVNAGNLEYTADGVTFAAVKVDVQSAAAVGAIIYTENTGATPAGPPGNAGYVALEDQVMSLVTVAGTVKNSLAPTPTIKTTGSAAGLVNGFVIDTATPITLAAANLDVKTDTAGIPIPTGVVFNAATAIPAGAMGAPVCATSICTVTFTNLGAVATAADYVTPVGTPDAADAAVYASFNFNTGVTGATVPFSVDGVNASKAAYSEVFNVTDGLASKLANSGGQAAGDAAAFAAPGSNITDGAAPVFVSATATSTGDLILTFSEPLAYIGGGAQDAQDLREVAENVLLNNDTIAALNLNADGALASTIALTAANLGALTITGIQSADMTGKQVTVQSGITLAEQNDVGYSVTSNVIDPLGGLTTAANETLSAAASAITPAPVTIIVGPDTKATAATTVADPTKVGSILLKFAAGKEVMLNTGKTLADLALDLVVTVNGLVGQTPATFKVYPKAADLVLSADGSTLTIDLPTDLIYANIHAVTTMNVAYAVTNVADVLVDKNVPSEVAIVQAGNEDVILPLSAMATINTLITQSITGTLTGASNGSRVHAHLAKWVSKPTTSVGSVGIVSGKITNPGDKVATDLAINFADSGDLEDSILEQLQLVAAAAGAVPGVSLATAAVKAAPIPVYVKMIRSVDATAANAVDYQEASAVLASKRSALDKSDAWSTQGVARYNDQTSTDVFDPVYVCSLDPNTGAITGRLTGSITLKKTMATSARGYASIPVAQGLVDANGKFNLLAGYDPDTAGLAMGAKGLTDVFLILVHEDQNNARRYTQLTSAHPGAANYLPVMPDLYSAGKRTMLGVAPGVAAPTTGTPVNINLANYKVNTLVNSTAWALMPVGNVNVKTVDIPRSFVGVNKSTGAPTSYWTNDGEGADMAAAMAGNKVGLATELGDNGDTLSTIGLVNFVPGAAALAFANDATSTSQTLTFAQAAAFAAKVPAGWSLVTVPAAGLNTTTVGAVLRVGAQVSSQLTWFSATDGAMPAFAAGEAVFVYSAKGGAL